MSRTPCGDPPDFNSLAATRTSFTANAGNWNSYQNWLNTEAACACGKRYGEQPRDSAGHPLDQWVTETECWECFEKRCAAAREAVKDDHAVKCPHCGHQLKLSM